MFKWQIAYTEMTNLLQLTITVPESHRQPQCTLQLVCEDRVFFVFFMRATAPKLERAIRLV